MVGLISLRVSAPPLLRGTQIFASTHKHKHAAWYGQLSFGRHRYIRSWRGHQISGFKQSPGTWQYHARWSKMWWCNFHLSSDAVVQSPCWMEVCPSISQPQQHHTYPDKDPTNPSNYRGITLLQMICKLLEKTRLWALPNTPCASAQGIVASTLHFFSKKRSLMCVSRRRRYY